MRKAALYFFITFILSANISAQQKIVLITNGKSDYKIIIPVNATEIEKQAAAVLSDYVNKISGYTLPITTQDYSAKDHQIIIGGNTIISENDVKQLGGDGFIVKEINSSLVLKGGSRKGTLYAIYTLLEDYLGCRMYTSGAVYIPKKTSVTLPVINIQQKPTFSYRTTLFLDGMNNNYCDFHKINYFFEDWGLWVHSFETLVPKAKYFKDYPEYFALVNGRRTADQLCLSNPAVATVVIENLQKLIQQKPGLKYWSVSQNDNDNFCECENCKRMNAEQGSYNGSLLPFVNSVAQHFPDKTIATLAYRKTEAPPKTLKPVPNVLIMLCSAYAERRLPLKEQTSADFYSNFKNWAALTDQLFIWDYVVSLANSLYPFPNYYTIQPNVQYFASKNVQQIFIEGIPDFHGDFSELRCYVCSRLMWNKNANVKAVMQEFINGYYGEAGAPFLLSYLNLLEKNAAKNSVKLSSAGKPADAANTYLSTANISAYKSIFNDALNAAKDPVYNARIWKEYLSVLYAELEINKAKITSKNNTSAPDKPANEKLLNDFYNKAKEVNVIYLNEAKLNVNDYYKSYQDLLATQKQ